MPFRWCVAALIVVTVLCMLDWIAHEARRWTRSCPVELALVAPLRGDIALPLAAIACGNEAAVRISPDQLFRVALACGADGLVVAHNHPDDVEPGPDDQAVTRRLVAAGAILGVPLRGHLVIASNGWFDCMEPNARIREWPKAARSAA